MIGDELLRAYLLSILPEGTPVQQNVISAPLPTMRVWYGRSGGETELYLDGSPALPEERYDIEVHGINIADVEVLAAQIVRSLHGSNMPIDGIGTVLGAFVEDHSDDYQYRGISSDEGFCVSALAVRLILIVQRN